MVTQENYDKAVEAVEILKSICCNRCCLDNFKANCPFVDKSHIITNTHPSKCLLRNHTISSISLPDLIKPEPPALFTPQDAEFIEGLQKQGFEVEELHITRAAWSDTFTYDKTCQKLIVHKLVQSQFLFPNIEPNIDGIILTAEQIQAEIAKAKGEYQKNMTITEKLKPCHKCGQIPLICIEDGMLKVKCLHCDMVYNTGIAVSKDYSESGDIAKLKRQVIDEYNILYDYYKAKDKKCPVCEDINIAEGDELRVYTHTDCDGGYIVETIYANYCPECGKELRRELKKNETNII